MCEATTKEKEVFFQKLAELMYVHFDVYPQPQTHKHVLDSRMASEFHIREGETRIAQQFQHLFLAPVLCAVFVSSWENFFDAFNPLLRVNALFQLQDVFGLAEAFHFAVFPFPLYKYAVVYHAA